jgi:PAS domain S-box-containing protein
MLLELSLEPILVWELNGPITYWNAGAASLYGYSAAEAIGRRSHDLLATVLVVPDEPLDVLLERDGRWMGELVHTTLDGRRVVVESRQELVRRPGGQPPLVLETNRDVTARKAAEAQLRAAKEAAERANATKSRFLAAASHDLRQPLQALDLQRTLLARMVTEPEALRTIQEFGRSIDTMRDTLDALLDLYQLESGAIAPSVGDFAVDELMQGIAGEFHGVAAAKGLRFRAVPTSAIVRSDRRLLERILRNLVANAVRYTQVGGILLGCRRRRARLEVQVWDTGIGIAADERDAIFEEFYQVGNPARDRQFGLGLGLAIARASAELIGSRLGVRSVPGKGSMFAVEVPFIGRAEPTRPHRGRQPVAAAASSAATILLVEDEPAIRGALRTLLGLDGHRVMVAATGGVAVAMVEEGACRPAMVIADQNLPGGLSGADTVLRLRELTRPRDLPALVITGDVLPERLAAIARAGLPHLKKPVDIRELRALVRTLLGDGPGAAANGRARPPGRRLDQLTPRERDVIDLVAVGLANREISARLGISSRTVEGHRAQAMRKLGVRTLAELIHLLVVPPPGLPPHPRP